MATLQALRLGLWLTRRLPYPLQRLLYWPFGLLVFFIRPTTRRIAVANQRQVLGHLRGRASWPRLQWQALRVLVNVIRNYHALLRLLALRDDEIRALVDFEGREHLDAALAQGRGAIILGAHLANYNILAPFASLLGLPVAAFVEPVQPPELFAFVSKVRSRTGLQLLLANREGAQAAVRLLRANGVLLVAGDRYLGANGTPVEFFGRPAVLPHGTIVLALRSGTPLIPATLRGRRRGRLLVRLRPPLPLVDTGRMREDLQINMRLVARALEETIGGAPEQWIVLNPVWSVDPAAPVAQPPPPELAIPSGRTGGQSAGSSPPARNAGGRSRLAAAFLVEVFAGRWRGRRG